MITILTPCYNEKDNLEELCTRIRSTMSALHIPYQHLVIDNQSTDGSIAILENLAKSDSNLKVIINARNFGHVRSPYYGLLAAKGDAVVLIASDLQDPPEVIPMLIERWEKGAKVVLAVKPNSEEIFLMRLVRKAYYRLLDLLSEVPIVKNATGAGLYDREFIEIVRQVQDPYPYLRGLVTEIGLKVETVQFVQPRRVRGVTKNNFYTLYDLAMLGITKHSKVPLRVMTIGGFFLSVAGIFIALAYFIAKLIFWERIGFGLAPLLIGMSVFASFQMFMLGLVGEYLATVLTHIRKLPPVVEERRINMDSIKPTSIAGGC